MTSTHDKQTEREAEAFRPDRRPFLFGLAANCVLAFVFLVLPYTRARLRATEAREAFADFAACFLGGQKAEDPGLALPAGEREHFADLVMHADAGWPARCDEALATISPDQATFLFPSVKQADADTRAAIDLVREEARVLRGDRSRLGHVPGRPLLAFARLRGSLAMLLDAAGQPDVIDHDAIHFKDDADGVIPSRVPLSAATGATLFLHSDKGVLEAHALDQRGLSWARVDNGKVEKHRPKRPRLLRALTFAPEPLLIWALSEDRCHTLEHGCTHRAMGVAPLPNVGQELPEAQWLTAHPPGRPDRNVVAHKEQLWVLALDAGAAGREVRTFKIERGTAPGGDTITKPAGTADEEIEPTRAQRLWELGDVPVRDAVMVAGTSPLLASATVTAAQSTFTLRSFEPQQTERTLTTLAGTEPFLLTCRTTQATWFAMFTEATAAVVRVVDADDTTPSPPVLATPLERGAAWPFHADDPARDRVRLVCDDERVVVLTLSPTDQPQGGLRAQACSNDLLCGPQRTLTTEASHFAALARGDDLVIATSGTAEHGQILVQRFNALLHPIGSATAPAACWHPAEGLCGQPALVQDRERIVLTARDQSDLLAIESIDSGATWRPMSGLRVSDAPAPDGAIMDIHRERKRYAQ